MADLEDVTLDGRPLQSLRVADLKAALEERGLSKSGQKNALVKRLKGALMLENLQKTSTPHVGLQPNSQIGEEMSQNSFIKQYLAKQQELLRQRLEREAREAYETNDQEDHTVNNNTSHSTQAEDVAQAVSSQHKPPGPSGEHQGETNSNQEPDVPGPPASAKLMKRQEKPAAASNFAVDSDDDSEDGEEDADDEDWDRSMRRKNVREPPRRPATRERSGASCQPQQQHIPPPLLSPQLRQPTPPPSPPPELSFPLPDTPKQSPPSPEVAPARSSPSTSSSGSSSSGSRSSSPEPQRGGKAERKPGPLTLLARKMESEGAFSGAGWHGRDGQCNNSSAAALNTARDPSEDMTSAVTHAAISGSHTAAITPNTSVLKTTTTEARRKDAESEREKTLELERQERQRNLEQQQALEEERERAIAVQREEQLKALQKEKELERERQEREQALAKEREEQEERQKELDRQRALEEELQRQKEEQEMREREAKERALAQERKEREMALEKERLERERQEAERKEQERIRREQEERLEQEQIQKEKLLEQQRLELERERIERERIRKEEQDRIERERALEQERKEKERERQEAERKEQERIRREQEERLEQQRLELERERIEQERIRKEEQDRIERERALEQERKERERLEKEKEEMLRLEAKRAEEARLEMERLEKERVEKERAEKERMEKERAEKERIEKERLEKEKAENERLERERMERERVEMERQERERAALERERAEKERLERERVEKERERAEKERVEKERLEMERLENDRLAKERAQLEHFDKNRALESENINSSEVQKGTNNNLKSEMESHEVRAKLVSTESQLPPSKRGRDDLTSPPTPSSTFSGEGACAPQSLSEVQAAESLPASQPSHKKFRFSREPPVQPHSSSPFSPVKSTPLISPANIEAQQVVEDENSKLKNSLGVEQKEETAVATAHGQHSKKEATSLDQVTRARAEAEGSKTVEDNNESMDLSHLGQGRGREAMKNEKQRERSSSNESSSSGSSSSSSSSSGSSSSTSSRERRDRKPKRDSSPQRSSKTSTQAESVKKPSKEAEQKNPSSVPTSDEMESERRLSKGEQDITGHVTESTMAEPKKSLESPEETPKAFPARKISLSSSKSPGPGSTEGEQDSGSMAGRKRRWGSSTAVTAKKPSISITTDSLKSLIPDIRPCMGQDAVVDLYPEEAVLSGAEDEDRESPDQDLQIRRTVTQVVLPESQENGQQEAKAIVSEETEENDIPLSTEKEPEEKMDISLPEAMEPQSTSHTSHNVETTIVTPSDTLVRRSISQQKMGVSITIDDPVRTARQPSPPRGKVSNIVHVRNLVRPFTLGQLKELLGRTGSLIDDGFWIDKIKSHCFVTYSNPEEAVATRAALHGVKWPQSNPKFLSVDFCQQDELDFHKNPQKAVADPEAQSRGRVPGLMPLMPERDQWAEREREMERRERARAEREWDRDKVKEFAPEEREAGPRRSRSREGRRKERGKSKEKKTEKEKPEEPPAKLLDDLFRKTKAAPCIYWLPLTEEQYVQREAAREERRKEREKLREEEDKKREEERKEKTKDGGSAAGERNESERDRDRARERERQREDDKRRDGYRRPGASGSRRSRSRSDPRERRH
ncbi:apoptotic chromatin condensation inducer in the nucleus [Synchiropus splendidus]|uniref:apoptotic chromatin condensation inducer in the nucleus n=1 Tax=Synchiropus splendidus TaxID=270530 RepID=UPI00237E18C0|nr:apoptotic chromatin condensation inducer in the nucleus [Synchiropus splendidus]